MKFLKRVISGSSIQQDSPKYQIDSDSGRGSWPVGGWSRFGLVPLKIMPIALLTGLLCIGERAQAGVDVVLFDNGNIYTVDNNPTVPAKFTISKPHVITKITNYHWNYAQGTKPGRVGLRDASGRIYGPWSVVGSPGQGGVPNANWTATPNALIPAGQYTILDSEPTTWSQNSGSGNRGFSKVEGYPKQSSTSTPKPTNTAKPAGYAIIENRSSNTMLIWVAGREPGVRNPQGTLESHLEPGWTSRLKVTIPPNGQINFVAGGRDYKVVAQCTWTGDPNDSSRIPHIVFNANGQLICGTDRK
jgi:hypothetical protein